MATLTASNATGIALVAIAASGVVDLAPKVHLNTTETLSGATEMTVTDFNSDGTSVTFTDPTGAPGGALKLGVESRNAGGGDSNTGWIDVTVSGDWTATGSVPLEVLTTSGVAGNAAKTSTGSVSLDSLTASGVATLGPRIYLNATQTLVGATQVPLVSFETDGTGATFNDTVGVPTGSCFLGVQERNSGSDGVGWIAVNISTSGELTASGTAALGELTASGVVTGPSTIHTATGAATLEVLTSSGICNNYGGTAGAPAVGEITASGVATQSGTPNLTAQGSVTLGPLTSSGQVSQTYKLTGAATLGEITASGVAERGELDASGSVTLGEITASGSVKYIHDVTGSAQLEALTSSGTAAFLHDATGAATLGEIGSSGSTGTLPYSVGESTLGEITTSGVATKFAQPEATGAATLGEITTSGTAVQIYKPTGAVSLETITTSGNVTQTYKPSGSVSLNTIWVAGTVTVTETVTADTHTRLGLYGGPRRAYAAFTSRAPAEVEKTFILGTASITPAIGATASIDEAVEATTSLTPASLGPIEMNTDAA